MVKIWRISKYGTWVYLDTGTQIYSALVLTGHIRAYDLGSHRDNENRTAWPLNTFGISFNISKFVHPYAKKKKQVSISLNTK
jgi:hypothetical protein